LVLEHIDLLDGYAAIDEEAAVGTEDSIELA
jgi:hypothetical protein